MNTNFKDSCFKCGGKIKKGYVQKNRRIAWIPKVSNIKFDPDFDKSSILLSKQSRFSMSHVDAYLCENCKVVVIDYSDNEE